MKTKAGYGLFSVIVRSRRLFEINKKQIFLIVEL